MKNVRLIFLFMAVISTLVLSGSRELTAQEKISNISYKIKVKLDDKNKMLYGKENITWYNRTNDEVQDMWFHLYYNAFKNEKSTMIEESKSDIMPGIRVKEGKWGWIDILKIKLADGRDLKPTMEFISRDKPEHPGDETVMRVCFPEAIKPGEEVHIQLEFQSKIPRTIARSGYYQDSYFIAQWFPKPGVYEESKGWNCHEYHSHSEFYADFADFIIDITVPEDFVVGASGKQINAAPTEAEKTVTYTYQENNIHDFAWTADPDFIKIERDFIADKEVSQKEYEEVAGILQLPIEDVILNDVKMILLIEPEHKGQIDRHFNALKAAIKYYGIWYGPYPYETVTMVDPPFRTRSGGMEYPTLFTAGTSILTSKDVLSPEGVIIHEFGHGYWYGMCANNEFEEAWLDEGINTYSTGKTVAWAYGPGTLPMAFNGIPLSWFLKLPIYYDYELDRAAAINVVELDPITTYSWHFINGASYGGNVYMRASTCLNTLERLVGHDVMFRILRTFQMRFRYKHPHTKDFIDVVNEVTERDLTWFFKELFLDTLNFDYGVSSLTSKKMKKYVRGVFETNGNKEEYTKHRINELEERNKTPEQKNVYITKVKVRRFGEAKVSGDVDVKLKIVFDDDSEEICYWNGQGRWKGFTFEKPVKAKHAQIDPDNIWLIDSNIVNNSIKMEASRIGIWKFTSKLLFWTQNCFQIISGLS